ncbi:hypothetical protein AN641_03890 [Candidatus Epulonipiscioides gigas]|nr:hypothetical protein AN641_03890 [Epulopiscium sp. SCG-C07WGA-EpuloA2]
MNIKKQKSHLLKTFCYITAIFTVGLSINSTYDYFNPKIFGNWTSTVTSEQVQFEKDGNVKVGDIKDYAYYEILSPTRLIYVIEDMSFDMYYEIEGTTLYWGENKDNLEIFKR